MIVGASRIKKIDSFHYYENTSDEIKAKYAGGVVWQKPITSMYPDEGLAIPYWKYMDNEEVLNHILVKPVHRAPFKYGSREVSDDDAIEIVNQLINVVDYLIEIEDDTENWEVRKEWLNRVLNELWKARGPYPGFASCLANMELSSLVQPYVRLTDETEMKRFRDEVSDFLQGKRDDVFGLKIANVKVARREFKLRDDAEQNLLLNILPRFDLAEDQVKHILSEERQDYSITASLEEIAENPYIIFEQYIGMDSDDMIPFYKIDNGIIVSPEYGVDDIFDPGATERLRAFCVDELNRIAAHSFGKAETILQSIMHRLDRMPEWKRYNFRLKNFEVEAEILEKAIYLRRDTDEKKTLYLYLKDVYEDERQIESVFKMLADRQDIPLKMAISKEKFKDRLRVTNSELNTKAPEEYDTILDKQADICMQIFRKPLCVLSGAAGTGKTTVIKAIVENIKRVHGQAAGFLLLAPTGKAAERIKNQTGERSSTIHSFLASNGWINKNFTLKRFGGSQGEDLNTVIIDECSMIDLNLFATLLRSINWNSVQRLILIGDPNQLPPIGRGRVFADTIDWLDKEYPDNVGVLTENIRQLVNRVENNGCGILDLAELFIQEKQTEESGTEDIDRLKRKKEELFEKILENGNGPVEKDLSVYFWKKQSDLDGILRDVMIEDMKAITGMDCDGSETALNKLWTSTIKDADGHPEPEKMQIISPYRGEFYGTDAINAWFQDSFNHRWSHKYTLDGIAYFDKVIQFRNRPKSDMAYAYNAATKANERREVFNGENTPPVVIYGNALFTKKVILYGSDGGTQRFVSDSGLVTQQEAPTSGCACCKSLCTLPTASVSLVEPMCLDTRLTAADPETGERLPDGEWGELVLTSVDREAVPVVRYRTRDITRIIPGECSCGRTHRRIDRLHGRTDDMLIIRGVNVFPSQIEDVMKTFDEMSSWYEIELTRKGSLDLVTLKAEVNPDFDFDQMSNIQRLQKEIKAAMKSALSIGLEIKIVEPKSIPRSEGKAKRIVDLREGTD